MFTKKLIHLKNFSFSFNFHFPPHHQNYLTLSPFGSQFLVTLFVYTYACVDDFFNGELSIGSLGKGYSRDYVSGVIVNGAKISGTSNGVRIKTWQVRTSRYIYIYIDI